MLYFAIVYPAWLTGYSSSYVLRVDVLQVNEVWERVQSKLGEQHQYYSGVANLWQTYNDAKQGVGRILDDVSPLISQDIAFSNQADVKRSLDQHKVGLPCQVFWWLVHLI